jgi:thioredoxin reductase (NADPH)
LREKVQDHIKGINFGYRVKLREEGVVYLKKLGKFLDKHTLECIDEKGLLYKHQIKFVVLN